MHSSDIPKLTDVTRLLESVGSRMRDQLQMARLTQQLEQRGISSEHASPIAERVHALAEGPIAHDDWMTLEAVRFKPETRSALDRQGLTADLVGADPDLAESYAGQVFAHEGIPDGNGGTERVRGVVPGHYDDGGHGIDLVAADAAGAPIPIEVKKYNQPSAARLEDRSIVALEPEVEHWRSQQTLASGEKELPVQQMDDLWTRDRWLKLVKSPEGQSRLRQLGVDERYLDYQRLRAAPDLPEWGEILDRRTTVIVSGGGGDAGKRLVDQALFERRSKRVVKIEV